MQNSTHRRAQKRGAHFVQGRRNRPAQPRFVELQEHVGHLSWEEVQALLDATVPWAAQVGGTGDDQQVALELQALRVGQVGLVGVAGEVFVQTGRAIKRRSPLPHTVMLGYTNGCVGYIPRAEEHARGGYEVEEAWLGYRLPAPIAPQGDALVEETALRLLHAVT